MFETGAERIESLASSGPFSRSAIYEAIKNSELVARKHGGTTIILEEDWRDFLRSRPQVTRPSRDTAPRASREHGA